MNEKKQQLLEQLEYQVKRRRNSVRLAGDDADKVYLGEDIGKLLLAIAIVKEMDWM